MSAAATELQSLATAGTEIVYSATYVFHLAKPNSTAIVKVWHAPPALRVDVISGTTTASLFITTKATYSCGVKPRKRQCFVVAAPGKPIPAPFNVGPSSLFSSDLQAFSRYGTTYTVTATGNTPGSTKVLATNCFAVAPGSSTPAPAVQAGSYCLADNGALGAVTYPSGNTATLSAITFSVLPANLKPYAKPQRLPS